MRNGQRNAPFGFGDGGNLTLSANALLDWDGKRWTLLNLGKTTTTLLPEEGTLIQLETPVFLHLIDTHVIQVKDTSHFLAKIEAYEAVLLQRQRDIENQIVVYHIEQKSAEVANTPQPVLKE